MKKTIFVVLAVLAAAALLFGCQKAGTTGTEQSGEPEQSESEPEESQSEPKQSESENFLDMRTFALSEQAAQLALSLTDGDFSLAEPCAYYGDIATYKISGEGEAVFCTFRLKKAGGYEMEPVARRENCYASEFVGEFYPTEEDGYPVEAFSPCKWKSLIFDEYDLGVPEKVKFMVTEVGSGQAFTDEGEIQRMREAVENLNLLPIERFLTSADKNPVISNTFSYYKNAEDENPYFVLYTDLVYAETADGTSRVYYPEKPEEYNDGIFDVYFEISNEHIKNAETP